MQLPYRKPGKYSRLNNDPLMTQSKFDEISKKLERLKKSQPAAAKEVSRLAELGDFSENVEYQLAKGRLRSINDNILRLENQLQHAEIIAPTRNGGLVQLGNTVTIISQDGKMKTYQILGSTESDPQNGIISHSSPFGAALLGQKVGDKVKISFGGKEVEYTITQVD